MLTALEALKQLKEGNLRFTGSMTGDAELQSQTRRTKLSKATEPSAIILGCSDARVPAEIVFDQGLGDLFVIRVAGNIVSPSQVGSVEFAAERMGTRLVVVLGHTECGAIQATIEALENPGAATSRNLLSIVDRVRPSVEGLRTNLPAMTTPSCTGNAAATSQGSTAPCRRSVAETEAHAST